MAAVIGDQSVAQRRVGGGLDGGIERRADRQATLVETLLAIGRHQVATHFLGEEVGLRHFGRTATAILQLLGLGGLRLGGGDVLGHAVQHIVAPRVGFLFVAHDIVTVRRLGQRREIGDLGERQLVE